MNETPDEESESSSYIRLPWQVVGVTLFLILVGLFGFGLFANRNLRPQAAVAPAAVAPTETATVVAARIVTSAPTVVIVLTPTPIALVEPTQTLAPAVRASLTPTARPTVDPALAEGVSLAYEHYWQVRAEALLNLDASRLHEVMDGTHLKTVEDLINDLNSEGRAIETNVAHNYTVLEASNDSAKIVDVYISNSVYVDIHDHTQISEPTGDRVTELYDLTRLDGTWKVVSLAGS
jgi:hypothetical protein